MTIMVLVARGVLSSPTKNMIGKINGNSGLVMPPVTKIRPCCKIAIRYRFGSSGGSRVVPRRSDHQSRRSCTMTTDKIPTISKLVMRRQSSASLRAIHEATPNSTGATPRRTRNSRANTRSIER
jgi:hypothetical protein